MCKNFTLISVMVMISCSMSQAYNRDRLVRIGVKDSPRFKVDHNYHEDTFLEFTERTDKYGYKSEAHTIVTEDGYILNAFRFLKKPHCEVLKQPPVILQHGIFVNGMTWLDPGPEAGLPYLLADECYDLWVTNSRGTDASRNHTKLNPDRDPEYWQFSFHEMGLYDFPATIDYVLNRTGNVKLNYVSHSQGAAAFLVMASLRPNYLGKVQVSIVMAPASWLSHTSSTLKLLAWNWKQIYTLLDEIGIQETLHKGSAIQELLHFACHSSSFYSSKTCALMISSLDGVHRGSVATHTMYTMYAQIPDGVSLKNLAHLAQIIVDQRFQQFDYQTENMKFYGAETPPKYVLNEIDLPIPIIYSDNDLVVNSKDVQTLRKHLKNVPEIYRIPNSKWNHIDYIYSKHIPTLLFPKVNEWLTNYTFPYVQALRRK